MAQKLTKVAETTTLANTDTLIVVDESAQNPDGSTGALKRIPKSSTGFAFPNDITSAINTEVSNRNTAISNAIDTEVTNRNNAIDEALSTKADAIVKTASGEIASFTDGGDDLPMKSLNVNIVPKQSGSGDPSPSNVRPISGTDTVNVYEMGGNYINESTNESGHIDGNGNLGANANFNRTKLIPIKNGANAFIKAEGVGEAHTVRVHGYDLGGNWVRQIDMFGINTDANRTLTVGDDIYFLRISYPLVALGKILLYQGEEPIRSSYQGTSYPVSLGQTVYGGTLEVISGKLTIDRAMSSFKGTENISVETIGGHTRFNANVLTFIPTHNKAQICSHFIGGIAPIGDNAFNNVISCYSGTSRLYWRADEFADGTAMKDYFLQQYQNGTPVTYVGYLATPIEVTLTPTQVKTLLGANNIWSDSGTVEVEYRADTTLAYNELLSLIASLS